MAQSPAHEHTDPLVGKSSVEQKGKPGQLSDAQQRPGVSGAKEGETGGSEGGVTGAALENAKKAAASLGEQAPGGGTATTRKDVETK